MLIRFTNYKRVYIILGVFIFVLISLYIASIVVKNKREQNGKLTYQQDQDLAANSVDLKMDVSENKKNFSPDELNALKALIIDKTNLLVNSVSENSLNYREDPVFKNANEHLFDRVLLEIHKLGLPITLEYRSLFISSDGRSGRAYVVINSISGARSGTLEFVYSKDANGAWKFVDFVASQMVQEYTEIQTP